MDFWYSFCHVLCDALEHLSGVCGSTGLKAGGDAAVDVQAALAVGLSRTFLHPGVAQFAFGFYSVMLTSTVLGLITMVLFKPRSWCVYCPMGTMTQLVCKAAEQQSVMSHGTAGIL